MRRMWSAVLVAIGSAISSFGCASPPDDAALAAKERIGVYDSRAVAIAGHANKTFQERMKSWHASLKAQHDAAKVAGDEKRAEEIEAEAAADQHRRHLQGFSTAPVDDFLELIRDRMPALRAQAGVSAFVSKWDEATLAAHPAAERIDVTTLLVDAIDPDGAPHGILEIQTQEPIPLAEAEKMSVND